MAQFAERLQRLTPELMEPILDVTDRRRLGPYPDVQPFVGDDERPWFQWRAGAAPAASDPSGSSTIFDGRGKQLGLKLEKQKRPMQVFVIDHLEQKPTDN